MTAALTFPGDISETHWTPPARFDYLDMEKALDTLSQFEDSFQFYVGDALIFARDHYGEEFAQLIPESKQPSWKVYLWVCEKVSPQIRKGLTFSQARAIARLPEKDQKKLIKQGAKDMTVKEINKKISKKKKCTHEVTIQVEKCTECGRVLE